MRNTGFLFEDRIFHPGDRTPTRTRPWTCCSYPSSGSTPGSVTRSTSSGRSSRSGAPGPRHGPGRDGPNRGRQLPRPEPDTSLRTGHGLALRPAARERPSRSRQVKPGRLRTGREGAGSAVAGRPSTLNGGPAWPPIRTATSLQDAATAAEVWPLMPGKAAAPLRLSKALALLWVSPAADHGARANSRLYTWWQYQGQRLSPAGRASPPQLPAGVPWPA